MPCRSDYAEPTAREIALSKVCCVLDELDNKRVKESWWLGYHPKVYCASLSNQQADDLTAEACKLCRNEENSGNIQNHSLELQFWWREHKKKDKSREQKDKEKEKKLKHIEALRALVEDYLNEHKIDVDIRIH